MTTPRPRWWPAVLLVLGAGALLLYLNVFTAATGQERFLSSVSVLFFTGLLLLLWLILLSRLPKRVRLTALGVLAVVVIAAVTTLRIDGVSGNLVPILNWRWAEPEDETLRAELESIGPVASEPVASEPVTVEPLDDQPPVDTTETETDRSLDPAEPVTEPVTESAEEADPTAQPVAAVPDPGQPTAAPGSTAPAQGRTERHRPSPQFLGPNRNAVFPNVILRADWEAHPPEEVWRRPVGAGWSSFAVVDGLVITQEQRGDDELVTAYRLRDGELIWGHTEDQRYSTTIGGTGPRATPTVVGNRVYALGATGVLTCLDLSTGRLLWKRDVTDGNGWQPEWGRSGSPLVVGDAVVVPAGGTGRTLAAYHRLTGEPLWAAGDDKAGYSSPALVELAGSAQIVSFNQSSITGHDPADGRILWSTPWPRDQPNVAQPLPLGDDRLLVSAGYGIGSKLYRVSRTGDDWSVETLWESPRLKAKFTNPVVHDGRVYGLDDGVMVCLDPTTGERCWKRGRYGHGQVLLAGDHLVVQAEDGDLVLVEPHRDELRELARVPALDGKTWNVPTLAYPYLLVRNDQEAVCYRLAER